MNIIAIGAHPDDIEIACSGTLMRCVERGDRVVVSMRARAISTERSKCSNATRAS